jgi:hypothetical protein
MSLAVLGFDAVLVEVADCYRLLRVCELAKMFALAMLKAAGVGKLIVLPPLGLLASRSKIDKLNHST